MEIFLYFEGCSIGSKTADKSSNVSTEPCLLSIFDSRSLEILVSGISVYFLD